MRSLFLFSLVVLETTFAEEHARIQIYEIRERDNHKDHHNHKPQNHRHYPNVGTLEPREPSDNHRPHGHSQHPLVETLEPLHNHKNRPNRNRQPEEISQDYFDPSDLFNRYENKNTENRHKRHRYHNQKQNLVGRLRQILNSLTRYDPKDEQDYHDSGQNIKFVDETRNSEPIVMLEDNDRSSSKQRRLVPLLLRTQDDNEDDDVDERTAPPPSKYVYGIDEDDDY